MPTYAYKCDVCENAYEEFHSFSDPHPSECHKCGELYGEGFRQDYSVNVGIPIVYGNPTTFGQQAEINAKRVGQEQMAQMEREYSGPVPKGGSRASSSKELPWFRSGEVQGLPKMDKPLDTSKLTSQEKVTEYVQTGKI